MDDNNINQALVARYFPGGCSLILLVLLACLPGKLLCQSSANTLLREMVYVHLDKTVYVAGEPVRYKVYLASNTRTGDNPGSSIVYFTLSSAEDRNAENWRINLDDSVENCYFTLPSDIKPGVYALKAYTNWMRNGPGSAFFSQDLLILNLSEPIPDSIRLSVVNTQDSMVAAVSSPVHLTLASTKAEYRPNESVQMEIGLEGMPNDVADANLSVSVSGIPPFENILESSHIGSWIHFPQTNTVNIASKDNVTVCHYMMENRAYILYGRVKNRKDNTPVAGADILLSMIDTVAPQILVAHTDSTGNFNFYLDRPYDNKKLFLQLANQQRNENLTWELDEKLPPAEDEKKTRSYLLKPEQLSYLNTLKNLRLINEVYAKPSPGRKQPFLPVIDFFGPPDKSVDPADYADLVNFNEIAENIVPLIKFRRREDYYELQILNFKTNTWNEFGMLLLNGVPFTDLAYIATLGTKEIRRVEVICNNFFIGSISFPGLLSIYTYDGKVPEIYLKNNAHIYQNTVMNQSIADGGELGAVTGSGDHLPDFRNCLYWNPNLAMKGGKNIRIDFPASQLAGKYMIRVEGLTRNGYPVSATGYFTVKD